MIYTDPDVFYKDLPENESKHWFSLVKTHGVGSAAAKATGTAWKVIPTSYLLCEEDLAIAPETQEGMIQVAKAAGADIDAEEEQITFLVGIVRQRLTAKIKNVFVGRTESLQEQVTDAAFAPSTLVGPHNDHNLARPKQPEIFLQVTSQARLI